MIAFRQVVVEFGDDVGSVAHRSCDPLHGACSDVSNGKYSGTTAFELTGTANCRSGQHKTFSVNGYLRSRQPISVGISADE
jgi:hypothetical protein